MDSYTFVFLLGWILGVLTIFTKYLSEKMKGANEMSVAQEIFLNNRVEMIEQFLGIKFTGVTSQDKENFFKQHEQRLNNTTSNMLASMYDVYTGKVKVFCLNDYDWVAAESLEEAIEFYKAATGLDDEEALDDPYEVTDLKNLEVTLDKMVEGDEFYQTLGHLQDKYLKSEDAKTFKVPAIELLFQEWQGKPYIFCSTEY